MIAGASGLVGFAALKHFSGLPDWEALALSRRRPPEVFNVRFIPADLTDERASAELAGQIRGLTHVVYAPLYERAELIAGAAMKNRSASMIECCAVCSERLKGRRWTSSM